jgi:predicted small secreted protein
MKYILLLLLAVTFSSCSTVKHAKKDFTNFRKTIELNAGAPVVLKYAYF